MVTSIDVRNYMASDQYIKFLGKAILQLSIELRIGSIPGQVLNIDANICNKAGVTLMELDKLYSDEEKVINFIRLHQREVQDDSEDDHYESETIDVLPSYANFLISYMVKYYLLKENESMLHSYLKLLRIPAHKKYYLQLKEIYSQL